MPEVYSGAQIDGTSGCRAAQTTQAAVAPAKMASKTHASTLADERLRNFMVEHHDMLSLKNALMRP